MLIFLRFDILFPRTAHGARQVKNLKTKSKLARVHPSLSVKKNRRE